MNQTLTSTDRVGEIVANHPQAARIFERHGIDYCCSGGRTLEQACQRKGLDPSTVTAEVVDLVTGHPETGLRWADRSMTDVADHIERFHHTYLKTELPRLSALIEKVNTAHGDRHPELFEVARVFEAFRAEMTDHMRKEEEVLFPAARKLDAARSIDGFEWLVRGPLTCLVHEHEEAGQALTRMRQLTGGYTPPTNACATYRVMLDSLARLEADTHQHVHKENNILFEKMQRRLAC